MLRNISDINTLTNRGHKQKSSERIAKMNALLNKLLNDEAGFIVSAELVLIATLGVLAMAVGLSEVAWNVNNELQDVGRAFGSMNQSFSAYGQSGNHGSSGGSSYADINTGSSNIQAGSHIDGEQ